MKKVIFVPGFLENPWLPRYRKFRQEFQEAYPDVDLDIVKMRWFLRVMTDYINVTHKALNKHRPHVAGGFSYGANALLIAAAKMDPSIRPKRLVLASISDNFAEQLRFSEWHPEYMKEDLKKYHLGHIADEIRPTTKTYVLATDAEISKNHRFGRHIKKATEELSGHAHPIVVPTGTRHPFNMASPLYREKIIRLLGEGVEG